MTDSAKKSLQTVIADCYNYVVTGDENNLFSALNNVSFLDLENVFDKVANKIKDGTVDRNRLLIQSNLFNTVITRSRINRLPRIETDSNSIQLFARPGPLGGSYFGVKQHTRPES
ncbi:small capsid protein [Testudinid alphaherpesvirus 3]|uniref:Small capsid protein n=1 Tax=Testudinid alphaherpesvirus 3 TaxID=2560801 RepID=A0A0K1R191_9ALPH|nr:small capsid protein [Testudinid alphaherpesvirus 3]AIU39337.1 small capsid protein [Testudinid alphaherpesvirus 3]AIU39432.1 small capsid protein [Testudinid alphaherpesvirus 3]AKI81707.1 small capsid protein [Testudinid alphaherpesvirus 3]AKI81808.1 small capsid protein [Testudinid alphaherpesvirus 3]AKV40707.1 UL35 small capsid protein [Testudinid alphaherpesvirus 3]